MTRQEEINLKSARDKKEGFANWMNNPMTKAMLSMLPPSEHLEVILQACFEQGHNAGITSVMLDIVEQMVKKPERRF